jgi:methyltransferase (TIGR00027 family)
VIEGRPSRTALGVAMRRAAHQLLDRPLVFEDPLALRILGPQYGERLHATLDEHRTRRISRALRAFLAVRGRLTEDLLAEAVAAGVTQYVVLGAGLDTFAYRNPHPNLRVFEVDFPATQVWKRQMVETAGIAVPPSLTYAPCDFAKQSVGDALAAAGIDASRPVFCSWLGVTMYLEREAVLATVQSLMPFIRAPGGLVFDYRLSPSALPLISRALFWFIGRRVARRVERAGEPFISSFAPGDLTASVQAVGASVATDMTPAELNARYLAHRADGLTLGPVGRMMVVRR